MAKSVPQEVSDAVHDAIGRAVADIRALGFEGAAPWRALVGVGLIALREEQCPYHGREDMEHAQREIDRHLALIAKAPGSLQ